MVFVHEKPRMCIVMNIESQDFLMELSFVELAIIKDSLDYLSILPVDKKYIIYFNQIIKESYYFYNDLENILGDIINRYQPCLELGKFLYLMSLVNSSIISWLLAISIQSDDIRYNHYYYLCIACVLIGEQYSDMNGNFQKDLLFNYLIISFNNIKTYSKNTDYNLNLFMDYFNEISKKWDLDSTFNKQLNKYIIESNKPL